MRAGCHYTLCKCYEFICCNISYEFMILSLALALHAECSFTRALRSGSQHAMNREHRIQNENALPLLDLDQRVENTGKCSLPTEFPAFGIHCDIKWQALWHWDTKSAHENGRRITSMQRSIWSREELCALAHHEKLCRRFEWRIIYITKLLEPSIMYQAR